MILNTAGKSATAERQAIAGTSAVVDTSSKFATGLLILVANHLFNRIFVTGVVDSSGKFTTGINDTGGK
jgi:hypothetical protein